MIRLAGRGVLFAFKALAASATVLGASTVARTPPT
ncbi:hypothetical protein OKW43_002562 [Paraburkholderia sp. WC7.3g]